jgi:P27 family predicted phage terminase small subunit
MPKKKIESTPVQPLANLSFNIEPAPRHLSEQQQKLFQQLVVDYSIDDPAGRLLLTVACEALDDMQTAQEQIARDGMVVLDRFGQEKVHPLLAVVRDSRSALLSAIKQLNLDVAPLEPHIGRPASSFRGGQF